VRWLCCAPYVVKEKAGLSTGVLGVREVREGFVSPLEGEGKGAVGVGGERREGGGGGVGEWGEGFWRRRKRREEANG